MPTGAKRDRSRDGAGDGEGSPNKKARANDPRCVIFFGNKLLQMPKDEDYFEGETPLCAPALRNGLKGCKNRDYKCNHSGPKKWSKALMDFMKEWMAADNCKNMKWNPDVMTHSVLNMTFSNDKARGKR